VFALDSAGHVLHANEAAAPLIEALQHGRLPVLPGAVAQVLSTGIAVAETGAFVGSDGQKFFDLVVVPTLEGAVLVVGRDVTLESNLRSTLIESRQRYKDMVDISSDFAWEIGPDGAFMFVSPRGALGHPPDRLLGRRPEEFVDNDSGREGTLPFSSETAVEEAEVWMRRVDGSRACLLVSSAPLLDSEGIRRGARGVCRDVTGERERDAALARANNREKLLAHIVRTINDVIDPTDVLPIAAESISRALGGAGCQLFRRDDEGYYVAGSYGVVDRGISIPTLFGDAEVMKQTVDGRLVRGVLTRHRQQSNGAVIVWCEDEILPWGEDENLLLTEIGEQMGIANEQIANHERMLTLSQTDALTGLFNRRAFFDELSRRFSRMSREDRSAALIYLDLDNFKVVNDRFGHHRGDEALLAVRGILKQHTRPADLLARLGGDEFAIWLEGADEQAAVRRCQQIIEAGVGLAHLTGSPEVPLTMSLGLAIHEPNNPENLQQLLVRADQAMYAVKRDGKGRFAIAEPADNSTAK